MKRAFTLIEVNLAMLIMAGGILSLVGLYGLGFRENAQSVEDVDGAAFADAVVSQLEWGLSQTTVSWTRFNSIQTTPSEGWTDYMERRGNYMVAKSNPESVARTAFNAVKSQIDTNGRMSCPSAPDGMTWGLVITHTPNSPVVTIAVRAANISKDNGNAAMLMAQPLYVTQVHFQGDPNK